MKKRQVLVINGGDSFKSYREVISFLKKRRIDFKRYKKAQTSWKATLRKTLGKKFEVIQPDMPNKWNAKYIEWKIWFEKFIPHLNREVVLVGHSLGGLFLAKYLSENRFPKKICATHLVAPAWSEGDFTAPKDLKRFALQGGKIFFYQSEDDPIVPFANVLKYQKALPHASVRIFRHRGHFNQPKFPELVRDIKGFYR